MFAYSDKQDGVFLFDVSTSAFKQLSSGGCLNFSYCDPLLVFESRYLAIRERQGAATLRIIDTAENYSVIIEEHVTADTIAVIYALNPRIDDTPTTENTLEAGHALYWLLLPAVFVLIGALAVVIILLYR